MKLPLHIPAPNRLLPKIRRVNCTPDPRWLSTDAAADPECIRWSATLRVTTPAWDAVFAKYTRLSGWTAPLEESRC